LLQAAHPLEAWTKQRYQRALKNVLDKLAKMVSGA
jgi:hypothetical protein